VEITNSPKIKAKFGPTVFVYTTDRDDSLVQVWLAMDVEGGGLRAMLSVEQAEQLIASLTAAVAAQRAGKEAA
jgi:ABC-type Fe3+-hydroxamate transport system substrate-binding protein